MDAIAVAIISAAASILVAAVSYFFAKVQDREAEWRQQKLSHYRELLEAISGIVAADGTPENQRRYARATNVIGLVASQEVLEAMEHMREASRPSNEFSRELHDAALTALVLAIRRDLDIRPKDDVSRFRYRLWSSGAAAG
jgi:hypothetical protein